MFVQASDFEIDPYIIPNLVEPPEVDEDFEDYCDQEEEKILKSLLGPVLYDQFILGLAVLPTPDAKWTTLRDGGIYVMNGKNYIYQGLVELLKPYIWNRWMSDGEIKKSQNGANLASTENAEKVSLAIPLSKAYNVFVEASGFEHCNKCKNHTLYGFLYTNQAATYPDWEDTSDIEMMNPWNI